VSIGVLGPIVFEVSADKVLTWQEAKRTESARWATHEVYMGKPKKEFIGPGLSRIDLPVRLDSSLGVSPRDVIRQMREQMQQGNALQFTVGGQFVGDFSIENMGDAWKHMSGSGVLLVAAVDLTLEEYA
jgi:phage protein U